MGMSFKRLSQWKQDQDSLYPEVRALIHYLKHRYVFVEHLSSAFHIMVVIDLQTIIHYNS